MKKALQNILKKMKDVWIKVRSIRSSDFQNLKDDVLFYSTFLFLLLIYLIKVFVSPLGRIKFIQKRFAVPLKSLSRFYEKMVDIFDTAQAGSISSIELIRLAIRHLKAKKTRTIVTIGGMSIGIGAIVFLLSLGYGFQRLIVSKVARLDEMKQIDVAIGQATSLFLNQAAIDDFNNIENVDYVLPVVSLVSKVSFNNSVSDVVAHGVTSEFLEQSAIKPAVGEIFKNEETASLPSEDTSHGQVAGSTIELRMDAKMKKEIYEVNYSIHPLEWKVVYQEPSEKSAIVGYTQRVVGEQEAVEVWGEVYDGSQAALEGIDDHHNQYSRWVKDTFPIWKKESCVESNFDCIDNEYVLLRESNNQVVEHGFVTENNLTVERFSIIETSGENPQEGEQIKRVQFSAAASNWLDLYSQPKEEETIIGLFSKLEDEETLLEGELFWGSAYVDGDRWGKVDKNENGQWLGYWIKTTVPIWRRVDCQDCENYYLIEQNEDGVQVKMTVYLKASQVAIQDMPMPDVGAVLGDATASAELSLAEILATIDSEAGASGSGEASGSSSLASDLSWVEIASAAGLTKTIQTDVVELNDQAQRVAVVNRAMLRLLGIDEGSAVGQFVKTTLVFSNSLFAQDDYQAESAETDFKIIGVVPNNDTPAFYFPFGDLNGTGIDNYSQIKVVVKEKNDLKEVRAAIESMGFKTSSVVDTVGRINSLFDNVRLVLLFLGMIALGVAALGMFNTLTVSLLEKTREVGLMKAMGMKSDEVKKLFLAESITIGISGGLLGLALGFSLGKLISFGLSTISIAKGLGVIDVVFIPTSLAISIVILSLVVGIVTGIFPARRTMKISALDALRYE